MSKILTFLLIITMAISCREKPKPVTMKLYHQVDTLATHAQVKIKPEPTPIKDTIPTNNNSVYRKYITRQVQTLLIDMLPGWQLPKPMAWDTIWFHKYKSETSLINYASADFNGDHRPDYAFILQNKKKGFAAWVLQSEGETYRPIRLTQTYKAVKSIEMGLAITPPGKIHYINNVSGNTETKLLQHPGITTVWFETSSETFYWENGRYASAITGD
jgi:hypothetical protein